MGTEDRADNPRAMTRWEQVATFLTGGLVGLSVTALIWSARNTKATVEVLKRVERTTDELTAVTRQVGKAVTDLDRHTGQLMKWSIGVGVAGALIAAIAGVAIGKWWG